MHNGRIHMTELFSPIYCCCCCCYCCCYFCPTILLARAAARRRAWHQSLGRSRPTPIGTVDLLDHGGPKAGEAWLARAAATEHEGGGPTPPTLFPSRPALLRCRRWVIRPDRRCSVLLPALHWQTQKDPPKSDEVGRHHRRSLARTDGANAPLAATGALAITCAIDPAAPMHRA